MTTTGRIKNQYVTYSGDQAVPNFRLRKISASVAMLFAASVSAQVATPGAPAAAEVTEVAATIVVTGSRIRGITPVGSSVVSIGRDEIESSSAITTAQLIQQVPQVFNLGVSENSRGQSGGSSNITYGSAVNLRGIGPYATLTLLNGRRPVPQGTSGQSIDPSIVPTLALERVEVVADGASAIYGSDAVAGVVNLVMRRSHEGAEAFARFGSGDHYDEHSAGAIFGHGWDGGRYTVAMENTYHSALYGTYRDFYRADQTAQGGRDYSETLCNPGNIVIAGISYAIPVGGVTPANAAALKPSTVNKCDNLKNATLIPRQERNALTFTFDQTLNDRVSVYADGFATRRTFEFRPRYSTASMTVPSTNAFYVRPVGAPAGTSETVQYSFVNDLPPNTSAGYSQTSQVTIGAKVDLAREWKFDASYTYGTNSDLSLSTRAVVTPPLNAALASSNPATAFNPFAPNANNAAIAQGFANGMQLAPGTTTQQVLETKVDGPLFELPGGQVRGAFGYEGVKLVAGVPNLAGTTANPTQAYSWTKSRNVNSIYGEVLIPIVGKKNAIVGVRSLEVDLATRRDNYSDFGGTTNPKIGMNWAPDESTMLKASHGTSFRAPVFAQIMGNSSQLFVQNYSDPTIGGAIRQGVTLSGGNLNLKPETATTNSLGFDFKPKALKGSKFNLTYFDIKYENQVNNYLADLNILNREALFAGTGIIQRNPDPAFIAGLASRLVVSGVIPPTTTLFVDGRNNNLGKSIAKGYDFAASYDWSVTGAGDFGVGVNGTYFTKYQVAITAAAPLIDVLNTIYNPLRYKARGTFRWAQGPYLAVAYVNYEPSYDNNLITPVQKVAAYTTTDLHLGYTLPKLGSWAHETTIGIDVANLFNKKPPYVNIAPSPNGGGGFDATLTNPIDRVIALSVNVKF
ncbi:MAG: TonB-dependent receptor [Proteobacteria bacterium]|nr:TonB-dependent receptor [Pseudomonadota bacterium]